MVQRIISHDSHGPLNHSGLSFGLATLVVVFLLGLFSSTASCLEDASGLSESEAIALLEFNDVQASVFSLTFDNSPVPSTEVVKAIRVLRRIKAVVVIGDNADAILLKLPEMRAVTSVAIYSDVTSRGVDRLARMKELRRLRVISPGLSDRDTASLGKLTQLKKLELFDTSISAAGLADLQRRLPKVEILLERPAILPNGDKR